MRHDVEVDPQDFIDKPLNCDLVAEMERFTIEQGMGYLLRENAVDKRTKILQIRLLK